LQNTCLGWPGTKILLMSDSQVVRITSVSHWCPALMSFNWGFWVLKYELWK
jgi:hypothetical protein